MKKICFFNPGEKIGGGTYWLTRLAKELAKGENYAVYYIDYKKGFSRTLIDEEKDNIKFIDYDKKQRYCLFEEECILVSPIHILFRLPIVNPLSKILFINWNNECLSFLKQFCKFLRYDLNYFLTEVHSHNAMVFVDGAHRNQSNQICEMNFQPNYIPLIMEHKEVDFTKDIVNPDEINIAILGRLVKDKVHAVNNVINQAKNYQTDKKIIFHIIGDGVAVKDIKKIHSKNIEVRLCGIIKDGELDDYLLKNIDVLFAMGTSVLNGASVGIPSYIIPTDNKPFNFNEFVFLPETTDLITGFYPKQKNVLGLKTINFETSIEDVSANKYELGQLCYEYVNKNYTITYACEQFKKALDNTTLPYTTAAMVKNIQEVSANVERKLPLKYKILDNIWRKNKKKFGDFKKLQYVEPLRYYFLNKIENYLLEKGVIMEDLLQGFKEVNQSADKSSKISLKEFNRVYLFNKFHLFNILMEKDKIQIESKKDTKDFELKLPEIILLEFIIKFTRAKNKYDNLYFYLFGFIPFLKIETRTVPYEKMNPKPVDFTSHKNVLKNMRKKYKSEEKINVLFFVSRISCFIWEGLYNLFKDDSKFNVTVCVIPFILDGEVEMKKYLNTTYNKLKEDSYNVIKVYDEKKDIYFDVANELKPDIIFHNKSYYRFLPRGYHVFNYPQCLNYIIEYGFSGAKNPDGHFNIDAHWLADKYFLPSKEHLNMAKEISKIKGKNCMFLGYLKFDKFFDKSYIPKDVWKLQDKKKKRIIWAPHWLFDGGAMYKTATFNEIYDFMLQLAEKYADSVQFAFKPHPMLYKRCLNKTIDNKVWTEEVIDEYYKKWETMPNCQLEQGTFEDLFLTSDGMIMDSISFMAEYMVSGKPSLFTVCENSKLNFDSMGEKVYSKLYHTKNLKADIEKFINEVIIKGNDYMKAERDKFVKEYLTPPETGNAAKNIYNYIKGELNGK